MVRRWACGVLVALPWLMGCPTGVDIPDGVFACETVADCPEGFECRADGLCYTAPDAGPLHDAAPDAAHADAAPDASADGG